MAANTVWSRMHSHRWCVTALKCIEDVEENAMTQQHSPVWFITGCSTGFGKELARLVLARGWRAVVTARNPDQLKELVSGKEKDALAVQLDVTNRAQIAQSQKIRHFTCCSASPR